MRNDKSRPRALTVSAVVLTVALILGLVGFLISNHDEKQAPAAKSTPVQTATITRTDLATTLNLDGKLGYGSEKPIKAGGSGQVTWLPKSGTTITRGEQLFRVDDQPVALFYGTTPLFRRLDQVGLVGRDVKVVATNLKALGYSIGYQPAVGSKVAQKPAAGSADSSKTTAGKADQSDIGTKLGSAFTRSIHFETCG